MIYTWIKTIARCVTERQRDAPYTELIDWMDVIIIQN